MSQRSKASLTVDDLRHPYARRKNNPPAGLATQKPVAHHPPRRYEYNPHLDPQLVWAGKEECSEIQIESLPLHIHEYIAPKAIIQGLQRSEPRSPNFLARRS
ncbi:MAG: hypothetical protein NZ580_08600 [Bacteroidia bacterium]|nr:hypothetical protein [Bacteroidia bacterium]MDW8236057.1 hypothetical protein [Bacteroidia bacterium]